MQWPVFDAGWHMRRGKQKLNLTRLIAMSFQRGALEES